MNESKHFLGWLGETAKDFTYEKAYDLALNLANYYKKNSSPGQKVIIGYDSRFLAKEFAEFFSCVMAHKGIKVFLSNKIVPSSVLVISSLHKKSMGTIVLTGDEFKANMLGVRAFDSNGYALNEGKLGDFENKKKKEISDLDLSVKKWIQKGYIEPFDPSICYENHIEEQLDFASIVPSTSRILFNPLFGSGILYFDRVLSRKRVHGYTTDNDFVSDFKGIEPIPSQFKNEIYEEMLIKGTELGFIVSPDCTTFEFIVGPKILSPKELVFLFAEHLTVKSEKRTIVACDDWQIQDTYLSELGFEVMNVDKEEFYEVLSSEDYLFAVDHLGRFYFEFHGVPDALMAGYYLVEMFNDKNLTPSSIHRKFETIGTLLNDDHEGGLA